MWQILLLIWLSASAQFVRTVDQTIPLTKTEKAELRNDVISAESHAVPASRVKQVIVDQPKRAARNAIIDSNRLWPGGRVPFVFDYSVPAFSKVEIMAAMQEIEASVYSAGLTCIMFVPRQSETDYLHIAWTSGDHGSTNIGRAGGRQELLINTAGGRGHDDNLNILMIVLGLYPEAMRSDRDANLNIDFTNTQSAQRFQKLNGATTDTFGLPFDYTSLLLYTPYQFASDPSKPVMKSTNPNVVMGQGVSLSTGDVSLLQHTYGCPVDTSNRVNILANSKINCHFHSNYCDLVQDQRDEFDWTLSKGPRTTSGTGPNADYSSGSGNFVLASSINHHNLAARLVTSNSFPAGEYCLRVSMYMYGSDLGKLEIMARHSGGDASLFSHEGALGNEWYHAYVEIRSKAAFSVIFQATIGNGDNSDIALDDIYLYNGLCIEWN